MKNDAAPSGADLSLLLVFEAVYAERQISRAAQRLGLAQPSVSNALGRLRRLTGDALFVRTGRGMEPTPHAERLAAPLREALAMLRGTLQARSQFDPAHDRRHFTLFLTDLGEAFFLPRLLARLRDAAPAVTLTTLPMPDLNPQAALERGEVDLAIGNLPDLAPGFYQQRLFREHYVAIMRPDHPLLGGAMNAERLADAHHAVVVPHGTGHSAVEQALVDRGLATRIVLRVQNFLVLPAIVSRHRPRRTGAPQRGPDAGREPLPGPAALTDRGAGLRGAPVLARALSRGCGEPVAAGTGGGAVHGRATRGQSLSDGGPAQNRSGANERQGHEPAERVSPVVCKGPAVDETEVAVHRQRRLESRCAAGFQADPCIAALARERQQFGEQGTGSTLAQMARRGAHGLDFAMPGLARAAGLQFHDRTTAQQLITPPGCQEGDLGPAQAVQVKRVHALCRRMGVHAGQVLAQQIDQPRPVPFDLGLHLRGRGAAQRVAGVEAAAQAQAVVHVFLDRCVEALQHRQRQFRQIEAWLCAAFTAWATVSWASRKGRPFFTR
jgi:DNA-binding transcriptional LysR family regulator